MAQELENPQYPNIHMLLYRARLLLEEGQAEAALAVLQTLNPDDDAYRREKDYLLGWGYTLQKSWDKATFVLLPLCKDDIVEENEGVQKYSWHERRALCLLRLGRAAVNLSRYEDASRHYCECLALLHDQRSAVSPSIHIRAHCGQGVACAMGGLYEAAAQHYEEALRLCSPDQDDEELADIYHGLCYTYRHSRKLIEARIAGEMALELYESKANRSMEGRVRNLLGRISFLLGDFGEAADYYTEAFSLAASVQSHNMVMINCTALADLRLVEKRLSEARRYSQRALEHAPRVTDAHTRGVSSLVAGKVARAEANIPGLAPEQRRALLEEANRHFEDADRLLSTTQAQADVAELYGRWAEVLEDLGLWREALARWRVAYEAVATPKGAGWF